MKYFALILLALALISCKKKTTVTIQAQDYISGSGATYAGQKYVVNEKWNSFGTKVKTVKEGYLDANGYASFDLKMKNSRQYILAVNQPENICYGGITQHYLEHEKSNVVNFKYASCAFSKLILNNVNCNGPSDLLVLYRSNDLEYVNNTTGWQHDGCVYWETSGGVDGGPIGYSTINYGNIYYKWIVTKNGVINTFYDTVFYPPGEYTTYQIDY